MPGRLHTVAAIAVMTFIPLVPLALWVYAKAASVDRASAVARNEHEFHAMRHMAGAKLFAAHSYPVYRWDVEGSLVPVDRYRTEFFLKLPKAVPPDAIVTYYVQRLDGWNARLEAVDCATLGLHAGCGAATAHFARGHVKIDVDVSESLRAAQKATSYAVYVSQ